VLFHRKQPLLGWELSTGEGDPCQQPGRHTRAPDILYLMLFPDTEEITPHGWRVEQEHTPLQADKWLLSRAKRDHCEVTCLPCSVKFSSPSMLPAASLGQTLELGSWCSIRPHTEIPRNKLLAGQAPASLPLPESLVSVSEELNDTGFKLTQPP